MSERFHLNSFSSPNRSRRASSFIDYWSNAARPHRTFVAKSHDLMMRCIMDFDTDARMIACPRTRTSDDAALAPTIFGADAAATHLERTRNQRIFHFGRRRDTSGTVSIRDGYATRHGIADRLPQDVWPATRQIATGTDTRARAPESATRWRAAGDCDATRHLRAAPSNPVRLPAVRTRYCRYD